MDPQRLAWQLASGLLSEAKGQQDFKATFEALGIKLTPWQLRKVKEAFASVVAMAQGLASPPAGEKRVFVTISDGLFQRIRRSVLVQHYTGGIASLSSEMLAHVLSAMEQGKIECHLRESAPIDKSKKRRGR